jgi:hypothetical protein
MFQHYISKGDVLRSSKVLKEDLFGLLFVRKSYVTIWDSYYGTIQALRPLFKSENFSKTINGFYLNHINESVRISYFVCEESKQKAISIFQNFFEENEISEIKSQPPIKKIVAEQYGGEELEERFRYFLALETQIGLDIIEADLLHARSLFVTYCLQFRIALLPVRKHFEPTFTKYSQVYASLTNTEKEQFLGDLEQRLSWTHMMVNFILGTDFKISRASNPLSIPVINKILERNNLGFQILLGWKSTP